MPVKSLLNMFQTRPEAVLSVVHAIQVTGGSDSSRMAKVRAALYSDDQGHERRWDQVLDAAEALGLLDEDRQSVLLDSLISEEIFARRLREVLQREEALLGPNSLLYIAYRAALGVPPGLDGGTPTSEIMDRAEEVATSSLGPSSTRRFQEDKMIRWRWWIAAAGLGFNVQRAGARPAFIICPVVALRDELVRFEGSGEEVPLGDLIGSMPTIPLMGDDRGQELPVGTGAALRILENEGLVRLVFQADASSRSWRLPGRPTAVTYAVIEHG